MFTPFVTDEHPIALYEGAPPQYTSDGLAIDIYTIMQIRLDLLQSDITLSDLAYKYNFSCPSFFSDYFRRNAGISPQEYRMRNASG